MKIDEGNLNATGAHPNQRIYKIDVAGETFGILGQTLEWYAEAIDMSRYCVYRCNENGDEIDFYAERKELTTQKIAFFVLNNLS